MALRFTLRFVCCWLSLFGSLSAAAVDGDSVRKIAVPYLKSLSTMRADFHQTDTGGGLQVGKVLIMNPGLVKFEYETLPITVVIDGRWLTYYDKELEEYSHSVLGGSIYRVISGDYDSSEIQFLKVKTLSDKVLIVLKDVKNQVHSELVFNKHPMFLTELSFITESGERTRVSFSNVRYNKKVDKSEFSIKPMLEEDGDIQCDLKYLD